jgi:prevent-host-death family protein
MPSDVAHGCYHAPVGELDSIGIRELRQHASRYVAMAKAGQRVPVTERGKLVAYLVPADEPKSTLERLRAAGKVRPAKGRMRDLLAEIGPPPPPEPGESSPYEELMRMRDEERY